jgi:hypothetical protein
MADPTVKSVIKKAKTMPYLGFKRFSSYGRTGASKNVDLPPDF